MRLDDISCGVVGLGYVGLTLGIHFDRAGFETIGYDIDEDAIASFRDGRDASGEYGDEAIAASGIEFTASPEELRRCDYVFVAVPTPVDEAGEPDLSGIEAACEQLGRHISDDTAVVIESTVYPGATRELLIPAVERGAVEQGGVTFSVGYSPERIVPGGGNGFADATKLVSAETEPALHRIAALYDSVVDAGVHPVESIETAEASKCLENLQRDVNIGLVNEFAMGCRELEFDLDPHAVLEAAGTKWNFHDYRPGIVGGHCIPVDPHYLRYRFEKSGFTPELLRAARDVNERMVDHVCSITVDALAERRAEARVAVGADGQTDDARSDGPRSGSVGDARVLLLGFSYKPDVGDLRNSGVEDVADRFQELGMQVSGYDPYHTPESVPDSYDFEVRRRLDFDGVDAVVFLTPHEELRQLNLETVSKVMNEDPVLVDVGNAFEPPEAEENGFSYHRL